MTKEELDDELCAAMCGSSLTGKKLVEIIELALKAKRMRTFLAAESRIGQDPGDVDDKPVEYIDLIYRIRDILKDTE